MNSTTFRSNLKHAVILLLLASTTLAITYLATEAMFVRKLLLQLVMPESVCWLGMICLTYFLFVNRQKGMGVASLLMTLLFTLAGSSIVARGLAQSLEEPYRNFQVTRAPSYDVIVLLGGGAAMGYNGQPQLGRSGDRIMVTLQMFAAGKAGRIVCTGSLIDSLATPDDLPPAERSKFLLTHSGVPGGRIETVEGRNTSEEMQNLAQTYGNSNLRIGVVTSAWHLPRAMRLAKANGLEAEPIPANFATSLRPLNMLSFIPSGSSMMANGTFVKEYLARLLGQ